MRVLEKSQIVSSILVVTLLPTVALNNVINVPGPNLAGSSRTTSAMVPREHVFYLADGVQRRWIDGSENQNYRRHLLRQQNFLCLSLLYGITKT
jgi:hypothetical protein